MAEWVDEWVATQVPSAVFHIQRQLEVDTYSRLNDHYGRFVSQFEAEYSLYAGLIDKINFIDKRRWPPHRSVQYVLLSYNAMTFLSAFDRLVWGYYEDAVTLIRSLYEAFVKAIYISCHNDPDSIAATFTKPPQGVRKFNLTNFLRDELKFDWSVIYEFTSVTAHANMLHTAEALRRSSEREGQPERFFIKCDYDPDRIEKVIPILQFVLLAHLRFARERLSEGETLPDTDKAIELLRACIAENPRPYWRAIGDDLDRLFPMLEVADTGGDWKLNLASTSNSIEPC